MARSLASASWRKNLLLFMIFTYGLSWLFWVPTALFGQDVQATAWGIPFLLGGFGPSAAGVILTHRYANKLERREFCRRAVSFRRISLGWYLFIFLIFPALFALSLAVNAMLGRPMPPFETLATIAERPVALVGLLIIGIIAGPISEELGWRGYAQDRLQMSWSVLVSTLILAVFWWGWHLPLFFIDGTTQQAWGFGTVRFWLFLLNIFPLSVLMAWVYNRNRRSTLAAILLHFTYNFTLALTSPSSPAISFYQFVFLVVTAVLVVATDARSG